MTYSYDRMASVTLDEHTIEEVRRLTQGNNHTEANIAAAKAIGAKKLVKKLELVLKIQDLEGHTPVALGQYRYALHMELQALAKRALSVEQFEQLIGSM